MPVIRRDPPMRVCPHCGEDITVQLDASAEYGFELGYEKRKAGEPDELRGAVATLTEIALSAERCADDDGKISAEWVAEMARQGLADAGGQ